MNKNSSNKIGSTLPTYIVPENLPETASLSKGTILTVQPVRTPGSSRLSAQAFSVGPSFNSTTSTPNPCRLIFYRDSRFSGPIPQTQDLSLYRALIVGNFPLRYNADCPEDYAVRALFFRPVSLEEVGREKPNILSPEAGSFILGSIFGRHGQRQLTIDSPVVKADYAWINNHMETERAMELEHFLRTKKEFSKLDQ